MIRLGITGGIGSGKSYVCHRLHQLYGVPVYDCDTRAKQLMIEHPQVRAALVALLGTEVYTPEGALNKPLVAHYLFASPQNAASVNAIVHPAVKDDFLQWVVAHAQAPVVVLESAILFESGFQDVVDAVLAVEAPVEVRIRRVAARDAATEAQIRARMQAQLSDEERALKAQYHLVNDGLCSVDEQLHALYQRLAASEF